jgi:4-amino-4-deoxy-L-arabinose transferase-like glycosyltransferase
MQATKDWRNWALVAACLLPFIGFWATGLTDLDEGFYGAVVANMVHTGDWITPVFNGQPWFEKPILAYWLSAPSVMLFGEDFGPRLPSVLCTLATALVLFRFLRRHMGPDVARVATAAYCGSLLVAGVGRMMLTDAPFVLALTLALTTFYESVTGSPRQRLWTAVALGAAVLAKGPVAGVLFVLIAGFTFWRMPDLRANFRGYWLTGFALFALVIATWYVPAYLANREVFVQQFLIEQNLGRFRGGDLAHQTPVWAIPVYFPVILFAALMPWSLWALRAKWFAWPQDPLRRYLWIWALAVLLFFSISLTKLPHYILPAVAPLVVLTVVAVMERRCDGGRPDFWLKCALAWSVTVMSVVTTAFVLDYEGRFAEVHRMARYLRSKEGNVVLFNVGREERDVTISTTLRKSAHPSFLYYAKPGARMSHRVEEVAKLPGDVWLVMEKGEMTPDLSYKFILGNYALSNQVLPFESKEYELWLLSPVEPEDLAIPELGE